MSVYYRTLLDTTIGQTYVNAIIVYANSQGWTIPSSSTISAMVTLVNSLVSSGIWNKLDIFYMFGYNDTNLSDFSRINWINPGLYTITYTSVSCNYTIQGFTNLYNSATVYRLDTNFNPSIGTNKYQLNDASIIKYTSFTATEFSFGSFQADTNNREFGSYFIPVSSYSLGINGSSVVTTSPQPGTIYAPNLFTIISRDNNSSINRYRKQGSTMFTNNYTTTSTSIPNSTYKLCQSAPTSVAGNDMSFSLFSIGNSFNQTQADTFSSIIATFRITIGL